MRARAAGGAELLRPQSTSARPPCPRGAIQCCARAGRAAAGRSRRVASGRAMPSSRGRGAGSAKKEAFAGVDSLGKEYRSATEMWAENTGQVGIDGAHAAPSRAPATEAREGRGEAEGDVSMEGEGEGSKRSEWYENGLNYWKGVEASVDGVLGGYGTVSPADIADSRAFLLEMYGPRLASARAAKRKTVAVDCGAGVGRISKDLLIHLFDEVDLVEPAPHFLAQAQAQLAASPPAASEPGESNREAPGAAPGRAAQFFCQPLQEFNPEKGRYDVVWVQWCIGHLTDLDLISFFRRALEGLRDNGLIILKENTCRQGFVLDNADSSITRSDAYFRALFRQAGLRILKSKVQRNFPEELFTVKMYALQSAAAAAKPDPNRKRTRNMPAVISV